MKVAVVHGPRDLRVDEVLRPTAGPDDIVIKVAAADNVSFDHAALVEPISVP